MSLSLKNQSNFSIIILEIKHGGAYIFGSKEDMPVEISKVYPDDENRYRHVFTRRSIKVKNPKDIKYVFK